MNAEATSIVGHHDGIHSVLSVRNDSVVHTGNFNEYLYLSYVMRRHAFEFFEEEYLTSNSHNGFYVH